MLIPVPRSETSLRRTSGSVLAGFLLFVSTICAAASQETADTRASADKSQFTLFHPTPVELMREMNTDRPDATESPYTVDAGHVQLEVSFLEYTYDDDGGRTDGLSILPANLKVGLTNNIDLQLVLNPYNNVRTKTAGVNHRDEGFGDTLLRLKMNFFGNDGCDVAFGIMPFVKFPTARGELGNDHFEGGLIVPLTIKLPNDFELGTMAEFDFERDADNAGYGIDFVHSVTLSHPIVGELSAFVEYAGFAPLNLAGSYVAQLDVGLTYGIGENIQLDLGAFFGLSREADDVVAFAGITVRQ